MDPCQTDDVTRIDLNSEVVRDGVEWNKMGIHTISLVIVCDVDIYIPWNFALCCTYFYSESCWLAFNFVLASVYAIGTSVFPLTLSQHPDNRLCFLVTTFKLNVGYFPLGSGIVIVEKGCLCFYNEMVLMGQYCFNT